MIETAFEVFGLAAAIFALGCWNCQAILVGVLRLLNGRRVGLEAYHEARDRFMRETKPEQLQS
jgi:hypothetical protein